MDETTPATTPTPSGSPMSKTVIYVVLAVVVLVLAGATYAFKHQIKTVFMGQPVAPETSQTSPTTQTPAENGPAAGVMEKEVIVEIDYTTSGFSPKTVTVKKGTKVAFINKSDNKMDVASNPHPTHTDYPELDQFKSSQKGQAEYDFVFDKVGTWGYHNHAKPGDLGTVIVTE